MTFWNFQGQVIKGGTAFTWLCWAAHLGSPGLPCKQSNTPEATMVWGSPSQSLWRRETTCRGPETTWKWETPKKPPGALAFPPLCLQPPSDFTQGRDLSQNGKSQATAKFLAPTTPERKNSWYCFKPQCLAAICYAATDIDRDISIEKWIQLKWST